MIAAVRPRQVEAAPAPWEPDPMLAAAARAGGIRLLDLSHSDQCWLVAHLGAAGLTVPEIAARCRCGRRKIQYLRADPLTAMISRWLIAEAQAEAANHRAEALDRWCTTSIAECDQAATRAHTQLDAAIGQIRSLTQRCRQETQRVNTYRKYLDHPRPKPRPRPHVDQLALF